MNVIRVYGADWCEDTQRTREQLDSLGVAYQYVDVDKDEAARQWVKDQNNGKQKTPTVDLGGTILIEPSNPEMEKLLRDKNVI